MNTYKELVYMCLDRLKISSDDSYFTEDHVVFLLNKYRAALIKKLLEDEENDEDNDSSSLSDDNYQTICLDLTQVYQIEGIPCEGVYLKSKVKVPSALSKLQIYADNYYRSEITFVSKRRMKYVGHNKWLKNFIYASLDPENYLYLTSANPQFKYLSTIKVRGIFEEPDDAAEYECCSCEDSTETSDSSACDPLNATFSLDDAYVAQVIDAVVQTLSNEIYRPQDNQNNASDDLAQATNAANRQAYQTANQKQPVIRKQSSDSEDE